MKTEKELIALKYLAKRQDTKSLSRVIFSQELIEQKDMSGISLLHILTEENYLYLIPKELITKENLSLLDKDQNTVLHIIAQKGLVAQIPNTLLSEEVLLKKNIEGNTPIHYAAMGGHLHKIPKKFLSLENILTPNNEGATSLHLAVYFKKTKSIPSEFLNNYTIEIQDKDGNTLLHTAAGSNSLKDMPKDKITIENICKRNKEGETVAHVAAKALCLNDIPQDCLTPEIMAMRSLDGSTALHIGCHYLESYALCQFTPKQLSTELLTIANNKGVTPIEIISERNLHLLPLSSLTKEILLWRNPQVVAKQKTKNSKLAINGTPLLSFCKSYHKEQSSTLDYICSLLDTKTLKAMKIKDNDAQTTINWHIMKKSLKNMAKEESLSL